MSSAKRRPMFGIISLVSASILYGFFGILTRVVGYNLPPLFQFAVRDVVAVLILGTVILLTKRWKSVKKSDWKWIILRVISGMGAFFASYAAFFYIPIGTAYFIFYSGTTVGGFIIGKLMYQERFTKLKVLSLILALIGLSMIYQFSLQQEHVVYAVSAFGGGIVGALWNTLAKKVSDTYSATQLNFLDFFGSMVVAGSLSLLFREVWTMPTFSTVWMANLLFVCMFVVGGQLIITGFHHVEAQIGSLILLLEIVFGALFAWLIFQETLNTASLIGGLSILAAVVLPELPALRKDTTLEDVVS